ncbi:MAG: SDR family NAD(P)-dependent oxidoreductase [Aureispira sp.]
MTPKRVSILGAGWLGAALSSYLEEKGYITQLSTASIERYEQLKQRHARVVQLQVQSEKVTGDWATFSQADVLIINITPDRSQPNSEQLASLLPLIAAAPIQHVLYISSTSVYPNLNRVVTEDEGLEQKEHILYKSEQVLQQAQGFETTILRLAGLIGGDRHPGRFFQRSGIIKQSQAPVNLIHRVDCLQCIHQILAQEYWGKVVNACADSHPLKIEFYPKAAQLLGLQPAVARSTAPLAYKIISNQKIKQDLGITFQEPNLMTLLDHWH